jgi:hypothetical protein
MREDERWRRRVEERKGRTGGKVKNRRGEERRGNGKG